MLLKLFPTLVYYAPIAKSFAALNAEILKEAEQIRVHDKAGQRWSKQKYPHGYTSYGSLNELHKMSSTFGRLEKHVNKHVESFAKSLHYELNKGELEMRTCWINMMRQNAQHSLHLHPISTLSGTYYVKTPKKGGSFKIEDPRLSKFMAQPSRKEKAPKEMQAFFEIEPKEGHVLIFESWLRHEVPLNMDTEERVSISFNYNWF